MPCGGHLGIKKCRVEKKKDELNVKKSGGIRTITHAAAESGDQQYTTFRLLTHERRYNL